MINLQPIHEKIRRELHKREKLLNRDGILFEGPQTDGTGKKKADANNIFAKSTWIRMMSPGLKYDKELSPEENKKLGNTKDVVSIGGGLLKEDGSMYFGYDDMYNSPRNTGENSYRPVPGIKNISVEYKDAMVALRRATIT